jgi:hypothetical protein
VLYTRRAQWVNQSCGRDTTTTALRPNLIERLTLKLNGHCDTWQRKNTHLRPSAQEHTCLVFATSISHKPSRILRAGKFPRSGRTHPSLMQRKKINKGRVERRELQPKKNVPRLDLTLHSKVRSSGSSYMIGTQWQKQNSRIHGGI